MVPWDYGTYFNMMSKKSCSHGDEKTERKREKNTLSLEKEKDAKKLAWTDEEVDLYAEVLSDTDYRADSWAMLLESLALKKSSKQHFCFPCFVHVKCCTNSAILVITRLLYIIVSSSQTSSWFILVPRAFSLPRPPSEERKGGGGVGKRPWERGCSWFC